MSDIWESYRNFLIFWIETKKHFVVQLSTENNDYINLEEKYIHIDIKQEEEIQVYRLLHECGHILIWENSMPHNIEKKSNHASSATFTERTYTVLEEVEAWNRALSLSKKLKIPVDLEKWEQQMIEAIGKYIKWAVKKQGRSNK